MPNQTLLPMQHYSDSPCEENHESKVIPHNQIKKKTYFHRICCWNLKKRKIAQCFSRSVHRSSITLKKFSITSNMHNCVNYDLKNIDIRAYKYCVKNLGTFEHQFLESCGLPAPNTESCPASVPSEDKRHLAGWP